MFHVIKGTKPITELISHQNKLSSKSVGVHLSIKVE